LLIAGLDGNDRNLNRKIFPWSTRYVDEQVWEKNENKTEHKLSRILSPWYGVPFLSFLLDV